MLSNWIKQNFKDNETARNTISNIALIGSAIALVILAGAFYFGGFFNIR
jgi:hypothetical protein